MARRRKDCHKGLVPETDMGLMSVPNRLFLLVQLKSRTFRRFALEVNILAYPNIYTLLSNQSSTTCMYRKSKTGYNKPY